MRAYSSAYYEKHPEKCAEAARRWASANLERCAVVARNRRARIRLAPGIHTATDIAAQFTRQHGRCYWMTTPVCRDRGGKLGDKYHVDHVIPVVRGGSNGPENLVIACPTCNRKKSAKFPHEFSDRLC
jgi:5-methylcytosine-specific restriction endonuclease McrA